MVAQVLSFDRQKIHAIPIWENRRRIKFLIEQRKLLYDLLGVRLGMGPITAWNPEALRMMINKGRPAVRRTICLAGLKTVRQCAPRNPQTTSSPTIGLDVIDELWSLETLGLSVKEATSVIEEAIGEYERDQPRARLRTWNPFFWLGLIVGRIAEIPVQLFSVVFGLDREKASGSRIGRAVTLAFNASIWIFALVQALAALQQLGWHVGRLW